MSGLHDLDPELSGPTARLALSELVASPARPARGVEILRDGAGAFPAMLELIDSAHSRVLFENFIFAGDATGRRFATALSAAARRGVEVRVLYDPVGTLLVRGGSAARMLRDGGATLRPYRPLSPYSPRSWAALRHRDHRKLLAVDGDAAVVGGLCISDSWAPEAEGGGGWRDTALRVRGPVVRDLEAAFHQMWRRAAGEPVPADPTGPAGEPAPAGPTLWMAADWPDARRVVQLYTWIAGRARRRMDITDAYLVLPTRARAALAAAAQRGVAVRVLVPGRNNHPLAGAAACHGYAALLEAGVELWEWQGAMVHAKTLAADGELCLVGSSNLDPLSLRRNFEMNLLVGDPGTAQRLHEIFARDLERSRRIELPAWRRRSRWRRLAESAGSLFAADL